MPRLDLLTANGFLLLTRAEQPFVFLAGFHSVADLATVYPELDPLDLGFGNPQKISQNMLGPRYDGTFTFPLEFSSASSGQCDGSVERRAKGHRQRRSCLKTLEIWDGDLDRGGHDGRPLDTDDPDTPPTRPSFSARLPLYAQNRIVAEGIAVGTGGPGMSNPPDEADPTQNGGINRYSCRPPSVRIEITDPSGRLFVNDNPSGNQEWERYSITEDPARGADVHVELLPWGLYRAEVVGMDHNNLNAWYCECTVWGAPPTACTPGFWKQPHHFDSWTVRFAPDDLLSDIFGVGPDSTLLEALAQGGGGSHALGRHAVAALLNASHPAVDHIYSEAEVIALVQWAYAEGLFEEAKDRLARANEAACPLH